MREYAVTLVNETVKKDTPIYIIKSGALAIAERKANQTGMAFRIWIRKLPWVPWEKLEDVEPKLKEET